MTDTESARNALEETRRLRAEVADKAACPPIMHAAFGLLMGALVASQALPVPSAMAVLAICMAGVAWMVQWQRKRMGFFVNGYRRGRTRRVALGLLAFCEAVLVVSLWLKYGRHIGWAPLAGGALVFPVAILGSYVWQAAYRADLSRANG